MPADVNNPPDVAAWTAGGAATAVETPPAALETPPVAPETPPTPETPPAAPEAAAQPSPAEQVVAAMVKGGLTAPDAQQLVDSLRTPQPIKDALEAYLDGKPYPVPKSLTFKLKSGTVERQATLEQLQREGMLQTDYTRRMQELAQQRREHQQQVAQWTARDAVLKEREKWFEEQRNEMLAAQKDPKKWEEYQEVLRLRAANPAFDKLYQDAMKAREDGATKAILEQAEIQRVTEEGVETATGWIRDLAAEYPAVNPERVRVILAYAWQNGQLPGTVDAVRQVYEGEMEYLKVGPGGQRVAELEAKIAALETAQGADAHNAATRAALDRAKAVPTSPAGGGPPAPARVVPPKPIPPDRGKIDEAISAWSKVRE